jgi:hypothetical protein
MRVRALTLLGLLALLAAAPAHARSGLRPFPSCAALLDYTQAHGTQAVGTGWVPPPVSFAGPVATSVPAKNGTVAPQAASPGAAEDTTAGGSAGTDFSTTNDQEAGVDEPDLVKTDGKTLFAVVNGWLHAVDVSSDTPALLDRIQLDPGYNHQLFLRGNRLLVLQNAWVPDGDYGQKAVTRLTEVDVSDPAHLAVVNTERADGEYVDARLTGDTARIVIASRPQVMYAVAAASGPTQRAVIAKRRRLTRRARLAAWRPGRYFHDRRKGHARSRYGPLVPCADVRHPVRFSGLDTITILTVDMARGLPSVDTDSILADADIVYGSADRLYVASQRWLPPAVTEQADPPPVTTEINEFDTSQPDETSYVATGSVKGFLLNQFALSQSGDVLRVAATQEPQWWPGGGNDAGNGSAVTTLATGDLHELGSVDGLGKGQRIYAVRFIGDTGYVVTFRQVDPLYTLDLSDPAHPKVAGSLELEGYSAYLHPVGPGLLLGVGRTVGQDNEPSGNQLSLFDVSDAANPKLLAQDTVAGSSSSAEFDHHAFLWWPKTGLAVMPVTIYDYQSKTDGSYEYQPPFVGAIGFHVTRDAITEVGRISHPSDNDYLWDVLRATVVGDRLFTTSAEGVLSSGLSDLSAGPFASFPDEQPIYPCGGPPYEGGGPATARQAIACPMAAAR